MRGGRADVARCGVAVLAFLFIPAATVTAQVAERVEVTAQPSPLNPMQPAATTLVDTERIEELPVRSRNYLDFVLLAPGVVAAPRSGLPDSGFSFAGLRPRSNTLTIDGLGNNDEFSGATRTELSLEAVNEFEVTSGSWSPEQGGGAGGSINVITRSGANVTHGDAFILGGSGALGARPFLENTGGRKPSLTRFRAGGAIGGAIVPDQWFFYAAGERELTRGQTASDIVAALPGMTDGLFPERRSESEGSLKVNREGVVIRLAMTNRDEPFNDVALADRSSRGTESTADLATTASWTAIIANEATNDVRGQFARRHVDRTPFAQSGPGVIIAGVAELGHQYQGDSTQRQWYGEAGDTFGLAAGAHFFRAGFDTTSVRIRGVDLGGFGGVSNYPSLDAFQSATPDSSRIITGDPHVAIGARRTGVFVSDEWTTRTLSIVGGARIDDEALPDRLGVRNRVVEPRFGFAWSAAAKWVVRGGLGRFADRIPLAAIERPSMEISEGARRFSAERGNWGSSSRQASVGVEYALTTNTSASLNAVATRGDHLLRTQWTPDAYEVQPDAWSRARAVTLALNRRRVGEVEWSAAYTWSRCTDNASDYDDLADEPGPCRFDQRHRFVASALIEVEALGDFEIAPILGVESGLPVNPTTGAYPYLAHPAGYTRNSVRLPWSADLDLRLLYYFKLPRHARLDLVAEAFNLLNRRNVTAINSVAGPAFLQPIEAAAARRVEFSLDYEF